MSTEPLSIQDCEQIAENNLEAAQQILSRYADFSAEERVMLAQTHATVAHTAIHLAQYKQQFGPHRKAVELLNPKDPR